MLVHIYLYKSTNTNVIFFFFIYFLLSFCPVSQLPPFNFYLLFSFLQPDAVPKMELNSFLRDDLEIFNVFYIMIVEMLPTFENNFFYCN